MSNKMKQSFTLRKCCHLLAVVSIWAAMSGTALGRDTAIYNGKLTSDLKANGFTVTGLATPTNKTDAATKAYVDAALGTHTADTNNPHKVTASQVGVTLDNGVITIDGDEITPLTSESDPTTGVTNNMPYVRGKKVLTSESDPTWRAWKSGMKVALGFDAVASGGGAMALGFDAVASNGFSTALGASSAASGDYSTAVGYASAASGDYGTALGNLAAASGNNSTALGYKAYAPSNSLGLAYTPDTILLYSSNATSGAGSTARSLRSYLRYTRKTLDAASFTAEDGVIYSLTLNDTMAASGIDVTLPESKDWVQDFILRLENPTTSATQFGDLGAAEIDYPNGKLTETGAIEAGTTNYFTFTETGAGRWMITSLPANK